MLLLLQQPDSVSIASTTAFPEHHLDNWLHDAERPALKTLRAPNKEGLSVRVVIVLGFNQDALDIAMYAREQAMLKTYAWIGSDGTWP